MPRGERDPLENPQGPLEQGSIGGRESPEISGEPLNPAPASLLEETSPPS